MDITTAATALATLIAALAAGIATWTRARQDANSREIRDLKKSNETLLSDLARDRDHYRNEIQSLRDLLAESQKTYDLLYKEYLIVKEENVSMRARIIHLEGLVNGDK